jgi:ribose-phosphate pyrophosphokinase
MRQAQIFSGSSHPALAESICDWLGETPGQADLGKFSNGETRVQIRESNRYDFVTITVRMLLTRINT